MVIDRLRRAVRRARPAPAFTLERQPDALPKTGLFAEPVRSAAIRVLDPEPQDDGQVLVTFVVDVRDAEDRRCSDLAVEARVTGPQRTRLVAGNTDLLGRIRFRMVGPAGDYVLEITDVAAGGLAWDPDAGTTRSATSVAP